MINGQVNAVSMPAVTQSVTQDANISATASMDGVQQTGGNFAGLLSGIQALAMPMALPDSGRVELEAGAENRVVDLLAGLTVLSEVPTTLETAETKAEDTEKTEVCDDAASHCNEATDLAAQMVLSAYLQPGKMPEVNIPSALPVEMLQNVAAVPEQPVAITALQVEKQPEQMLEELPQATGNASQQVKSDRMSDVKNMTTLHADTPQKVTSVSEKTEISSARSDRVMVEQAAVEPVKVSVLLPPVAAAVTAPEAPIVVQDTSIDDQHVTSGKNASVHLTVSLPAASPESELEIQLSQPQPITVRATTAAVSAENRSAALVPELQGAWKQFGSEQQIEKVRTGNELDNVIEMPSTLPTAESAGESTFGSGTSQGGEGNQGQSGGTSDNQMLAQNMRIQLGTEHQKISSLSTKAATGEPVRQDIPEQVMQQVKERLVQHEVKPGNQQITLTLSPDSLGELKMNLNLQGQKLSVEIVTENRSVRDIIVQHTDALKESLARQNITMESFDVSTGGKGPGNQGQNQNAWRELAKQQQQQSWMPPRGYNVAQSDLPSGHAAFQRQQGQSMLDIHY